MVRTQPTGGRRGSVTGDDIPYVRVFRGMIADYYDGVVDDEGMMNAMGAALP